MDLTTNLKLKKPSYEDGADIAVINENMDVIDEQIENLGAYGVASGINTYTAAITGITTLTEGFTVRIKFTNANTGASTLNINSLGAKSILKGNGSTLSSGNIKAGQICNLAYTGSNFQLLGEGGEYGTATSSDVLSGKTIGTEEGLVTGTMPNRGAANQNLTAEGQEYTIPSGYHNGLGKIKAVITGLVASVIKAGTTVGGVLGTFTSDATAEDGEVLSGRTYYKNGAKGTGSMPVQGQKIQYLSQQNEKFIIARGYHTGDGFVQASFANLSAGNIKDGVNIGGIVGSLKPMRNFSVSDLNMKSGGSYIDELDSVDNNSRPSETNSMLFHVTADSDGDVSLTGSGTIFICPTRGSWTSVSLPYSNRVGKNSGIHVFNPNGILVGIQYSAIVNRFIL